MKQWWLIEQRAAADSGKWWLSADLVGCVKRKRGPRTGLWVLTGGKIMFLFIKMGKISEFGMCKGHEDFYLGVLSF